MILAIGLVSGTLWFAIDQTFSRPQSPPMKSHYSLQFSVSQASPLQDSSGNSVQTSIRMHISKWDQNYDKTRYQVFIVLTTSGESVTDVYTNQPHKFVLGGWYNLNKINHVLKMHKLAEIPYGSGDHSWLYVSGEAPVSTLITATTQTYSPVKTWRIVVMAEKRQASNI